VVDNDPGKEFAGVDQQLNKGIEVLMNKLKTQARAIPPYPVKTPETGDEHEWEEVGRLRLV
jgi:hypothetical protein